MLAFDCLLAVGPEHARVFRFHADGEDLVFISSADAMERNLLRRVEICVPVLDPRVKQRVIDEALVPHLKDTAQALFDVDDYGQSHERNDGEVPRELEDKARLAVANCPEFAISLEE